MMEVKIVDRNFAHAYLFGNGDLKMSAKEMQWYRGNDARDICFFTDMTLGEVNNFQLPRSRINVAWLLEPPSVALQTYNWIKSNYEFFDYVLTYNKELLSISPKFKWYPHGGCWIYPKDWKVHRKSKDVSMIASNKNFTAGHRLRHDVMNRLGSNIDLVCGRGHKPFEYKLDVLKDYRYSIVIENGRYETYFTEKLIDCFMTGTVPIYWGCSLKGLFEEGGILYFETIDELQEILRKIREGEIDYDKMLCSVYYNVKVAERYAITENWIYENFIKRIV